MLKKVLLVLVIVLVAAGAYFAYRIGPRNIIGRLRYDQRKEGKLKVNDRAPDLVLARSDGAGEVALSRYFVGKPTVLVFGSYT